MRRNETAVTLVALVAGVSATLALFFGNFSLAYLVQAFSGERVPVGSMLLVMLVAALSLAACGWAGQYWWRARRQTGRSAESAAPDLPTPTPPLSRADSQAFQRQLLDASRTRLLELAAAKDPFTFEQGRVATGLEQIELEYLLDDLIQSRQLRSETRSAGFVYTSPRGR